MTTDYHSRRILGSDMFENWVGSDSDQRQGLPQPAVQKPVPPGARLIDLPAPDSFSFDQVSVLQALRNRKSRRDYRPQPLSLSELAFLCWAAQGVREYEPKANVLRRTAPSAGARQPFETYLGVMRVEGVEAGLYRYLSIQHQLCLLNADPDIAEKMAKFCSGFARGSASHLHLDSHPLPHRVALLFGGAQVHRPGLGPCLPEPVPGLRGHRLRHLRGERLRPKSHGCILRPGW